jgi:hypothetical protein
MPYISNRCAQLLEPALQNLSASGYMLPEGTLFTYYDKYKGAQIPDRILDQYSSRVESVDYSWVRFLDDKRDVTETVRRAGLQDIMGQVFLTVESALEETEGKPDGTIFYIKPRGATLGRGIRVVTRKDLQDGVSGFTEQDMIQIGIQDIELVYDSKFTLRLYMLVTSQGVHLYNDGYSIVAMEEYFPDSTDYAKQVDHFTDHSRRFPISHMEQGQRFLDAHYYQLQRLLPAFDKEMPEGQYALFGYDGMIHSSGRGYICEFNAWPNLLQQDSTISIRDIVIIPMLRDLLGVVLPGASQVGRGFRLVTPLESMETTDTTQPSEEQPISEPPTKAPAHEEL